MKSHTKTLLLFILIFEVSRNYSFYERSRFIDYDSLKSVWKWLLSLQEALSLYPQDIPIMISSICFLSCQSCQTSFLSVSFSAFYPHYWRYGAISLFGWIPALPQAIFHSQKAAPALPLYLLIYHSRILFGQWIAHCKFWRMIEIALIWREILHRLP